MALFQNIGMWCSGSTTNFDSVDTGSTPVIPDFGGFAVADPLFSLNEKSPGDRSLMCEKCGSIKRQDEVASYGGRNHVNLGLCKDCDLKK